MFIILKKFVLENKYSVKKSESKELWNILINKLTDCRYTQIQIKISGFLGKPNFDNSLKNEKLTDTLKNNFLPLVISDIFDT